MRSEDCAPTRGNRVGRDAHFSRRGLALQLLPPRRRMTAPLGGLRTLGVTGPRYSGSWRCNGTPAEVSGGQDRPRGEGHGTGEQGSDGSRARALGGHLADYPVSPSSSGLCCGSGRQSPALGTSTVSQGSTSTSSPLPLSLLPWNEWKVALSSTRHWPLGSGNPPPGRSCLCPAQLCGRCTPGRVSGFLLTGSFHLVVSPWPTDQQ